MLSDFNDIGGNMPDYLQQNHMQHVRLKLIEHHYFKF